MKALTLILVTGFIGARAFCAELNPAEILKQSIVNYQKDSQASLDYTYTERDVTLDAAGRPKTTDVSQVIVLDGTPYSRLIGKNGHTLSPDEALKENEKYRTAVAERDRETKEERARRIRKFQDQWQFLDEIPAAFNLKLIGHESIGGRANYVIELTPKAGYVPKAKYARIFPDIEGKLWVDEEDLRWTQAKADVIDTVSMGWILARIGPGAHITIKQVKVDGEHWMPKELTVQGVARILLVKSRSIDETVSYSGYKRIRPDTGTAAARNAVPEPANQTR